MSKQTREARQSRERLRIRNRNISIGVATSVGALAAGIGSVIVLGGNDGEKNTFPAAALQGSNEFIAEYGCADPQDIVYEVGTVTHDQDPTINVGGRTIGNVITISPDVIDVRKQRIIGVHETGHACTEGLVMFGTPYESNTYPAPLLGSDGFKAYFGGTTYTNTIEEGVVEWLSGGIENYSGSTSQGYIATAELTDIIANMRGLDRQTVQDMHQDSDLVTFVAYVKNIPITAVDGNDIADVIFLYQDAYTEGVVPTDEEISFTLNF